MNHNHRIPALLLAAVLLLPSLAACKKSGISLNQASALMNELDSSGAINIEEVKAEQEAAAAEAAAKKAEEEAAKAAAREAAKAALNNPVSGSTSSTPAAAQPVEPAEPVELKIDTPVEAVPLENLDLYTAPAFTPEVYDPADTRAFRILGSAYSDGDWAVVYGECPVGLYVTAKTADGEYGVQSEGGCFALRMYSPKAHANAEFTLSYNGEQIGDPIPADVSIILSSFEDDPSWGVWIGYGNQGFYQKMIPDYTHTNLLSDTVKENLRSRVAGRVEKLSQIGDGCELIYLLVPASMTVYPELVPESVQQGEGESRFDQLKSVLTEAGATVIDARESFAEHKNDALPLYFDYDSHWTDYGAYIAAVQLYDYISDRYPAAKPREFSEFTWDWNYFTRGDMPYYFDVDRGGLVYEHNFIRNMNFEVPDLLKNFKRFKVDDAITYSAYVPEVSEGRTYDTKRPDLPDIYVFRNSYSAAIFDLLIERSDRAVFNTMFTYTYNYAQIKSADPDYVIYVVSEWDFGYIIDN
ncbi:MAG: hypothetical protein J6Q17_00235 [Clostridia bacterium]|nr:hypothetical protein [Clostridia bacterium]